MNVVCTAHDAAYQELADVTRPSLERYAALHGFKFVYDPNVNPTEKDACKSRLFLSLYASGAFTGDDLFLWVDTDALIMNSEKGLTARDLGDIHFLWAYDWNGPNSGVWAARFTSKAAHFVRTYDYLARAMGWGDNWAMNQTMLLPPFSSWVMCTAGKMMNCNLYSLHGLEGMAHKNEVNNYEPGDWILHLAGVEATTRMRVLKEYAALAV